MTKEFLYFVYLQGNTNAYNCNGLIYETYAKNRKEAIEISEQAVTVYNGQYLEALPASKCKEDLYDVSRLHEIIECNCLVCGKSTGKYEWQDRNTSQATYCGCIARRNYIKEMTK
jgi:hypothetical protein